MKSKQSSLDLLVQSAYSKLSRNLTEKALYSLSSELYGRGNLFMTISPGMQTYYATGSGGLAVLGGLASGVIWKLIGSKDYILNELGKRELLTSQNLSNLDIKDYGEEAACENIRNLRLKILVAGVGMLGMSIYSIYNKSKESSNYPLAFFTEGIGMVLTASSMYLKDRDPKAGAKLKDRLNSYVEFFKPKSLSPIPAE